MRFAALQTLVAVVARGSFAAGADEVGITPSAVSLQMQQLEAWFGRSLFDRSGRTARATPLAREIAATVARSLAEVHRFRAAPPRSVSGVLRLGAIPSVQSSALPVALRFAQTTYQDLQIRLTLAVSNPLLAALKAGELDAAIVVRPKDGGSTRVVWRDLVHESFVLVVPAFSEVRSAQQALREFPWIRYDASLTGGRAALRYVQRACPGLRPAFEVADTDAIVAMVAEGLGVSVIPRPRPVVRNGYAIRELDLGIPGPVRRIALACRRSDAADLRIAAIHEAFVHAYRKEALT